MKIIWKGSISFGLVNIPIKLYTAVESHALGFTLLHDKCHTPLKYHRWCPHCEKEVVWADTVKGVKTSKGYLALTKEMLAKLRPEKSEKIAIVEFIDAQDLDPLYLNHQYFVAPAKESDEAFALFMHALDKLGKVAIGRFVMRDKEYTCAIRPYQGYMLLTTLHYSYEIKNIEALQMRPKVKMVPSELKLAEELINKLSVKKFDISQFKDTFAQQIKLLLKAAEKKKLPKAVPAIKKKPALKKKSSLMDTLRASLETTTMPRSRR